MGRPSAIQRLPAGIRGQISTWRAAGRTIEEIRAALEERGHKISKSCIGRHTRRLDAEAPGGAGAQLLAVMATLGRIEGCLLAIEGALNAHLRGDLPRLG